VSPFHRLQRSQVVGSGDHVHYGVLLLDSIPTNSLVCLVVAARWRGCRGWSGCLHGGVVVPLDVSYRRDRARCSAVGVVKLGGLRRVAAPELTRPRRTVRSHRSPRRDQRMALIDFDARHWVALREGVGGTRFAMWGAPMGDHRAGGCCFWVGDLPEVGRHVINHGRSVTWRFNMN